MAASNLSFAASVDSWVRQTDQRMTAVFRESTKRVASLAANAVPVDTGFARASVRASTQQMPSIVASSKGTAGKSYQSNLNEVVLTIAGAQIGQTIYIGWTASYVLPLEYGHSKKAPNGFVRLAAAQWQMVVSQVTQEAKARAAR